MQSSLSEQKVAKLRTMIIILVYTHVQVFKRYSLNMAFQENNHSCII